MLWWLAALQSACLTCERDAKYRLKAWARDIRGPITSPRQHTRLVKADIARSLRRGAIPLTSNREGQSEQDSWAGNGESERPQFSRTGAGGLSLAHGQQHGLLGPGGNHDGRQLTRLMVHAGKRG